MDAAGTVYDDPFISRSEHDERGCPPSQRIDSLGLRPLLERQGAKVNNGLTQWTSWRETQRGEPPPDSSSDHYCTVDDSLPSRVAWLKTAGIASDLAEQRAGYFQPPHRK